MRERKNRLEFRNLPLSEMAQVDQLYIRLNMVQKVQRKYMRELDLINCSVPEFLS